MSIFDGIRKKLFKISLLIISVVLMKNYSRYPTCCMGVLDGQRAGSKPQAPSPKFGTAVQSYV